MKEEQELLTKIKQQEEKLNKERTILRKLEQKYTSLYEILLLQEKYSNKFYKYQDNCYSCPESPNDYWNVYYYIYNVNDKGNAQTISFQKDKNGEIRIINGNIYNLESKNIIEIRSREFVDTWDEIIEEINKMADKFL